ncbi:tRNA uridine-5-carboxymethylaminomethyl(34) synthesis GTPase MnmE [Microvirga antarctica]|uniref:tRNA uridine-5-carboxymethylaminomethyl(34) synthesis GTPase MnmE n=1 Tax=Microvirga antarctica TaxID=2819233 RepID=UPI001B300904|nr:tRNA uridine-5-carboxymethylaminomethyl(34) synthesis GTPase MnmE [Microvirga antarctica]
MRSDDTIFAPASGFGRAAVCVVRISGPQSRFILETIAGPLPAPRQLALRTLRDPVSGESLDQALVAFMPGPGSFTAEDQAELQIHGGLATQGAVLRAVGALPGCRAAEPGEFTRRAFLNGRMDLTQVEGLADLIDAETEAQRRQALRHLEGRLGNVAEGWREEVLQVLAMIEAGLDFSDEGDVPDALDGVIAARLATLEASLREVLASPSGERLRDGLMVVLAGVPNAGKSTLLNALARRDVAIVSPIAGTTRDVIEVRCDLGGFPVTIVDTAGLRETGDAVEQEGVRRAEARVQQADLVLWLVPPDAVPGSVPKGRKVLRIGTKSDLNRIRDGFDCLVSAETGEGMEALVARLRAEAEAALGGGSDALLTRERHRTALTECHASLLTAMRMLEGAFPGELVAEEVRMASRALGRITGRVGVEDVLDRLFAGFCIGK